jgi:hypothetical protein
MSYYLLLLLGIILVLLVACQPAATIAPTAMVTPDTPSPTEPSATPSVAPTVTRADPTPTNSPVPPSPTQEPATPEATPTDTPLPPTDTPSPPPPTETAADADANADVEQVRAVQSADGSWTFYVTVSHPDTGWEDYADGWDVLTPDGTVFKPDPSSPFTRLLLHPHETEQPFTRSQGGIAIPPDVTQVLVRAHDLVDGYGGREVIVDLTVSTGPDFDVERSQ